MKRTRRGPREGDLSSHGPSIDHEAPHPGLLMIDRSPRTKGPHFGGPRSFRSQSPSTLSGWKELLSDRSALTALKSKIKIFRQRLTAGFAGPVRRTPVIEPQAKYISSPRRCDLRAFFGWTPVKNVLYFINLLFSSFYNFSKFFLLKNKYITT